MRGDSISSSLTQKLREIIQGEFFELICLNTIINIPIVLFIFFSFSNFSSSLLLSLTHVYVTKWSMIFSAINSWDFLAWKINVGVGDENIFSHKALWYGSDRCVREKATCARTSITRRAMFLAVYKDNKSTTSYVREWKKHSAQHCSTEKLSVSFYCVDPNELEKSVGVFDSTDKVAFKVVSLIL